MEIKEVKEARESLAKAIGQLIEDFEWDTGTMVGNSINITRSRDELHPRRLTIGLTVIVPE